MGWKIWNILSFFHNFICLRCCCQHSTNVWSICFRNGIYCKQTCAAPTFYLRNYLDWAKSSADLQKAAAVLDDAIVVRCWPMLSSTWQRKRSWPYENTYTAALLKSIWSSERYEQRNCEILNYLRLLGFHDIELRLPEI